MSGKMKSIFSSAYKKSYRNRDYVKDNLQQQYWFGVKEKIPPHIEEAIELIKKLQEEKNEG